MATFHHKSLILSPNPGAGRLEKVSGVFPMDFLMGLIADEGKLHHDPQTREQAEGKQHKE
jgi:hypothetical protein